MSDGPDAFAPFSVRKEREPKDRRGWRWAAWLGSFLVGLVMLGVLGLHFLGGALACSQDTSYCVDTRVKSGFYTATAQDGAAFRGRRFEVDFEHQTARFEHQFRGPFCLRWTEDYGTPTVTSEAGTADLERFQRLSRADPPADCVDVPEGVQWHTAYDLDTSWQYRSVLVVGLLGLGLLIVAGVLPAALRVKVRNTGVVVCLADIALYAYVWSM